MARKKAPKNPLPLEEMQSWREAHPSLNIPEDALLSCDGFPSLGVMDYATYLKSTNNSAYDFVKRLGDELRWAYDNWQKAQRDADSNRLFQDIFNNASHGAEYAFVRKFLADYAKANNIKFMP